MAQDLDFLRNGENAPLAYDETRHGYMLTDETYALPPVNIKAFSFGLARKLLAHYEGTPLHLDMKAVLGKIAESLDGEVPLEPDWHPPQTLTQQPDDRVEMRLNTSGRQELIRWVLSWMPDVRLLAPKSLKDRIEEKLRDGLARQSGIKEVSTNSSSGQAAEPWRSTKNMKKSLKYTGRFVATMLLLAGATWGWWELSRSTDVRIIGEWKSDPIKTLAYWAEHYDWAEDPRMVEVRGNGLGKMSLEVTGREVRFHDHPCHGSPMIAYRIVSQTEEGVDIQIDYSLNLASKQPWGRFEFDEGGMWSITRVGPHEVREYFIKVEQDRGADTLPRAVHD